jgi:hypothetical protein
VVWLGMGVVWDGWGLWVLLGGVIGEDGFYWGGLGVVRRGGERYGFVDGLGLGLIGVVWQVLGA